MNIETAERAKLSFDLDDDDEGQDAKEEISRKVEEISRQSGFNAKAPQSKSENPKAAPKPEKPVEKRPPRRRPKTGRTYPFNTKIKPETYDKIVALADKATEDEGRLVSMAEIIERGMDLLEAQKKG